MKWKLTNIPKNIHLYWGRNKPLSFMRYMTYHSLRQLNKDWNIFVWTPSKINYEQPWLTQEQKANTYSGSDWIHAIKTIQVDMEGVGISDSLPEVQKSDLFRYYILNSMGGIWVDFDILFVKPIEAMNINSSKNNDHQFYTSRWQNNIGRAKYTAIGFMMCPQSSKMARKIFRNAILTVDRKKYQSAGRKAIDPLLRQSNNFNIPFKIVYPFDCNNIGIIYSENFELAKETIGIHWYGGFDESSRFEMMIDHKTINDYKHLTFFKMMNESYCNDKV
jgi:hypothetical protein